MLGGLELQMSKASDLQRLTSLRGDSMISDKDGEYVYAEDALQRIAELEAQCESLQNKCAQRGLSPEDSDTLQAENEKLRAVYEAARALSKGQDWNKGTMALRHGYRKKLIDAIAAVGQSDE